MSIEDLVKEREARKSVEDEVAAAKVAEEEARIAMKKRYRVLAHKAQKPQVVYDYVITRAGKASAFDVDSAVRDGINLHQQLGQMHLSDDEYDEFEKIQKELTPQPTGFAQGGFGG